MFWCLCKIACRGLLLGFSLCFFSRLIKGCKYIPDLDLQRGLCDLPTTGGVKGGEGEGAAALPYTPPARPPPPPQFVCARNTMWHLPGLFPKILSCLFSQYTSCREALSTYGRCKRQCNLKASVALLGTVHCQELT